MAALGGLSAATGLVNAGSNFVKSLTGGIADVKGTMSGSKKAQVLMKQSKNRRKKQNRARNQPVIKQIPPTPVAKNFQITNRGQQISVRGGTKILRVDETIHQMKSSTDFNCIEINYAPGNKNTFPVSGPEVGNYTKFFHLGTLVVYTPNVTTDSNDMVHMAYTKNAIDKKPTIASTMDSRLGAVKGGAKNPLALWIPADDDEDKTYWVVDSNTLSSGQDPQFSYPFALWLATDLGDATGTALGTVQIFHHLKLLDFKANTEEKSQVDIYNDTAAGTGVTKTTPFGTAGAVIRDNSLGAEVSTDGTQLHLYGRGFYHIKVFAMASAAITAVTVTKAQGVFVVEETYVDEDPGASGAAWVKRMSVSLDGHVYLDFDVTTAGALAVFNVEVNRGNQTKYTSIDTYTAV